MVRDRPRLRVRGAQEQEAGERSLERGTTDRDIKGGQSEAADRGGPRQKRWTEVSKMIGARSGEQRWSARGAVARRGVWRQLDEADGGKKLENRVRDQRPGGASN